VNRKVGAIEFLFLIQADSDGFAQNSIDGKAAGQGENNRQSDPSADRV